MSITPSNRRLLVVTESLGVGGTESHLLRTLPPLQALGWTVAVFCLTERGERAEQMEAAGVQVFSASRLAREKGAYLRYPAHVALAANKLYWLLRRMRPEIAHFYLPAPYLIGAPAAIAARIPIKVMSRRSLSHYQQNWPMVTHLERRLHGRMDAVIANSLAVMREVVAEGVPVSKVRLIYNGIEPLEPFPDRAAARAALGLEAESLVGVTVANLIPYKGHRELITGLSQVASSLPSPWRILVAGRDQGLRGELEALAARYSIGDRIQFLGEYPDVPRLLAAADFGLLTSLEEGFSNAILEGMSAGLPMIVTNAGGNPEAVIDGKTGCVVPPRDPEAIGAAILRLARDPALRERLGAAGRHRAATVFTLERCVKAHAELYEELLQRVRAKGAAGLAAE